MKWQRGQVISGIAAGMPQRGLERLLKFRREWNGEQGLQCSLGFRAQEQGGEEMLSSADARAMLYKRCCVYTKHIPWKPDAVVNTNVSGSQGTPGDFCSQHCKSFSSFTDAVTGFSFIPKN